MPPSWSSPSPATSSGSPGEGREGGTNVLFIHGAPGARDAFRSLLAHVAIPGLRLYEAADGEGAIHLLRERPFRLILASHRLGAISGTDVLEIASVEHPDAYRVLVVAQEDEAVARQAVARARVHAFVRHPWDAQGLLVLLVSLLRSGGVPVDAGAG